MYNSNTHMNPSQACTARQRSAHASADTPRGNDDKIVGLTTVFSSKTVKNVVGVGTIVTTNEHDWVFPASSEAT
eukprot:m.234202 g.234202  ORF g.234202 m.234202 type:complete len:74 (+) comp13913_c0_seq4:2716-2937(+)